MSRSSRMRSAGQPVNCAVVGLGVMGKLHADALLSSPNACLLACCDIDAGRSAGCPAGALFTTDLDAALRLDALEAVVVATPPDTHREVVESALEKGLAVMCEKPIAGSLGDADAMLAAATGGARLFVGHIMRFDSRYAAVRAALDKGILGSPISITGRLNSDISEQRYYAPRTTLAREMAVHHLDVFRWLAGDVVRISAELAMSESGGGRLESSLVAALRFRSGAVGSLQVSWAHPPGGAVDHGMSLVASNGIARVEASAYDAVIQTIDPSESPRQSPASAMPHPLRLEVETFLSCVRGRGTWPLTLSDARAALALSLALEETLATGIVVELAQLPAGAA